MSEHHLFEIGEGRGTRDTIPFPGHRNMAQVIRDERRAKYRENVRAANRLAKQSKTPDFDGAA